MDPVKKIESIVQADGDGQYSKNFDLSELQDGNINIQVLAKDAAGNTSEQSVETVIKDTAVTDTTFAEITEITSENVHQYTISGHAEPNSTVSIILEDSKNIEITLQAKANTNGNFTSTVDTRSLADGPISISSYTVDAFGNKSEMKEAIISKETIIPAPVVDTVNPINAQNANKFTIIGTARPDAKVEIVVSDGVSPNVVAETQADLNGEFFVQVDLTSLIDSDLVITASQTGENGVQSPVSETTILKDTAAPGQPELTINEAINQESQSNYDITGFAEKNAKVYAKVIDSDGNIIEEKGIVNENDEFTIPVDASTLVDGEITLEVFQIDEVGNLSATSKKIITKDTGLPSQLEIETLPGVYSGNETEFEIKGVAEPLLQIEMSVTDGTITETHQFMTDGVGKFSEIVDLSKFSDGDLTITFAGIDKAGNRNVLDTMTLIKDTVIEDITLSDVENYINSNNTNEFLLSGSSNEEGATITIVASDGTTEITASTIVQNGQFSFPIDLTSLADGPVTIEFAQKDIYRNARVVGTITLQKDTIAENPIISKNGFHFEGNNVVYSLNGVAEPGATVKITFYDSNGHVLFSETKKANANGFYSLSKTLSQNDAGKIARTEVTQTDVAGNTSEIANITQNTHTVSSGDTLTSIAKRYNTTVAALKSINQLTVDIIQPGQEIILPVTATEVVNLGYMYGGTPQGFADFIDETAASINIIAPSYFDINPDGTLKLTWAVNTDFIKAMHDKGVRVVPFLSNHWDRELGRAMLRNKEVASTQIAQAIEKYNLDGVNVDIENVTDEDRADYTEFVRLLREKIPDHKEVSVAVAANPNSWKEGWHDSYDNKALAETSDYLMIMAYDESFVGGDPGPVASYEWVERTIIQAIKDGVRADQIVLGIAHYGRYWKDGDAVGGFGISNIQVEKLVQQYNGTVIFDQKSLSPMAKITIGENDPKPVVNGKRLSAGTYTIWFENEESIQAKLTLVNKYNLRGVGNWNIEQGTDGIWNSYAYSLPNSVPVSKPYTPPVQVEPDGVKYSVVAGDSLSKIAKQFGTTVNDIKEHNNLTSDMIFVGQTLYIHGQGQADTPIEETPSTPTKEVTAPVVEENVAEPETPPAPNIVEVEERTPVEDSTNKTQSYVVSPGDSLYMIAKKHNTTVAAIKALNTLTSDTIYVGQTLQIPSRQSDIPSFVNYTVVAGDTLSHIAKRYNTTVNDIKQVNKLSSDLIRIGQTLKIPT